MSNHSWRPPAPSTCIPDLPLTAWRVGMFIILVALVLVFVGTGHTPLVAVEVAVLTGFGAAEATRRLFAGIEPRPWPVTR